MLLSELARQEVLALTVGIGLVLNSVLECVGKVLAKKERVNVLVNSAGYALMGGAEETSIAEAKAQFETTTRARFDQRHASAGTSSRRRRLGFRSD